jgi:hypothetical protein
MRALRFFQFQADFFLRKGNRAVFLLFSFRTSEKPALAEVPYICNTDLNI